jgi:hypothetical protein
LLGMQFAVSFKPGLNDIRDWPSNDIVDFQPESFVKGVVNGRSVGYYLIPNNMLPMGSEFFVSLRNINGQNTPSLSRDAGPFKILQTPPDFFNVSFRPLLDRDRLWIRGSVEDLSGITRVRYRIVDKTSGKILQEGIHYEGTATNSINLSRVVPILNLSEYSMVGVSLFAENAAGLTRAFHQDVILILP